MSLCWSRRFLGGACRYLSRSFEQHFSSYAAKQQFLPADAQLVAVRELGRILSDLQVNRPAFEEARNVLARELNSVAQKEARAPPFTKGISYLFRMERQQTPPPSDLIHVRNKGAYIYGPVGQGKTVLLDLLNDYLADPANGFESASEGVLRCHYHHFMMAVHQALYEEQQQLDTNVPRVPLKVAVDRLKSLEAEGVEAKTGFASCATGDQDLVVQLAKRIVAEGLNAILLDEFQITNISDALICKRLFSQLFQYGVALICTSNCPIGDLYQGGLNRDRFLDFLPILRRHCTEVQIDTKRDLRMVRRQQQSAETGTTEDTHSKLRDSFTVVTPSRTLTEIEGSLRTNKLIEAEQRDQSVPLFHHRAMKVDYYNPDQHVAVVSFDDLCRANSAPADFIALARNCSQGMWVYRVPRLDIEQDQEPLRRFINFIDVIYDENVPIVLDMAAPPLQLIQRTRETPQLWGDFTLRMRQQANTFDEAWDALFGEASVGRETWISGCEKGGLHSSQASLLWGMMPLRQELLCREDVRNGMCLYLVYGVADTSAWTGELFEVAPEDSNQMWTRSFLRFLCGADTPDAFAMAVEAAGKFDGFPCSANTDETTASSDVVFAVPRLLSRLIQIQKDYQLRHPLLCAQSAAPGSSTS